MSRCSRSFVVRPETSLNRHAMEATTSDMALKAETVVGAELYASLYAHDPPLARLIGCWPRLTVEDRQVLVDQAVQLATEQNERQQTVSHSFVEEPVQTKESFGRDAIGSRR